MSAGKVTSAVAQRWTVLNPAWRDLPPTEKAILEILRAHARLSRHGLAWPSLNRLEAIYPGCRRSRIIQALRVLEDRGFISRAEPEGRSTKWHVAPFNLPPQDVAADIEAWGSRVKDEVERKIAAERAAAKRVRDAKRAGPVGAEIRHRIGAEIRHRQGGGPVQKSGTVSVPKSCSVGAEIRHSNKKENKAGTKSGNKGLVSSAAAPPGRRGAPRPSVRPLPLASASGEPPDVSPSEDQGVEAEAFISSRRDDTPQRPGRPGLPYGQHYDCDTPAQAEAHGLGLEEREELDETLLAEADAAARASALAEREEAE